MQSLDGGNYESKTHQDQGPDWQQRLMRKKINHLFVNKPQPTTNAENPPAKDKRKTSKQTFAFCWKWGGGGNSLHHEGILCWEKLANANKTEQGKETNLLQKNAVSESEASRLCENLKEDKERKQNCITL